MSDLEHLLQQQLQEGTLDSAGHFTVDREEALRKLTQFQLQVPEWWILKVVQAAQAGGARSIDVRFSATGVQIEWDVKEEPWTVEEVERELWNPETTPRRSLDHLKRGLWVVGFRQGYPFQLQLPGLSDSLLFHGAATRRHVGSLPSSRVCLTVSHRGANHGFSLLGRLETSNRHDHLSNVLRVRAHACAPILSIGPHRVNAIQASPTHGYPADQMIPFWVGSAPPMEPNLLPPRSMDQFKNGARFAFQPSLMLTHFHQNPAGAICLFGVGAYISNRGDIPTAHPSPSYLHWMHDGVIVDSQKLPLPDLTVSVALFASAEGLRFDLSGFGLVDSPERKERVQHLLRLVASVVQQVRWDVPPSAVANYSQSNVLGAAVMLGAMGAIMSFTAAPVGIPMAASGVLIGMYGKRRQRMFLTRVAQDLQALQEGWADLMKD